MTCVFLWWLRTRRGWRLLAVHACSRRYTPTTALMSCSTRAEIAGRLMANHATKAGRTLILTFLVTITDAVTSHSEHAVGDTSSRVTCIILFGINEYRYLSPFYRFIKGTRSQNFWLEITYLKIILRHESQSRNIMLNLWLLFFMTNCALEALSIESFFPCVYLV